MSKFIENVTNFLEKHYYSHKRIRFVLFLLAIVYYSTGCTSTDPATMLKGTVINTHNTATPGVDVRTEDYSITKEVMRHREKMAKIAADVEIKKAEAKKPVDHGVFWHIWNDPVPVVPVGGYYGGGSYGTNVVYGTGGGRRHH